jgi:acetyl-CoA carboxylase carboxyltransferase component
MSDRLEELRRRHAAAEAGGGEERRARQHKEGKLSARERIDLLLDEATFEETDKLVRSRSREFGMQDQIVDGDGFITGVGPKYATPLTACSIWRSSFGRQDSWADGYCRERLE